MNLRQIAEDFMATYGYESATAPQRATDMRATRGAKRSGQEFAYE
jgi:hypothetical protein